MYVFIGGKKNWSTEGCSKFKVRKHNKLKGECLWYGSEKSGYEERLWYGDEKSYYIKGRSVYLARMSPGEGHYSYIARWKRLLFSQFSGGWLGGNAFKTSRPFWDAKEIHFRNIWLNDQTDTMYFVAMYILFQKHCTRSNGDCIVWQAFSNLLRGDKVILFFPSDCLSRILRPLELSMVLDRLRDGFVAHLSRRFEWAIAIAHGPSSVRRRRRPSGVNFSHFRLLLQNRLMDFDET